MTPEFSHTLPIGRIGPDGFETTVEAGPEQRSGVARRLGIVGIDALACAFRLYPASAGRIEAEARLRARVVQTSVVSLEPFAADIAEDFACVFVPAGTETDHIDPEAVDELPYEGTAIDLGEAATEQLALALDPYPRAPGEETGSGEAGPGEAGPERPLAKLSGWRGRS